jgi:fatty acid-binding protein DegV
MPGVRVVADSAVCLPKELIEKYEIELVPETIIFGTTIYRDGIDLVPSEFYVKLGQAKELPTTSAPSPQDFIDAFQKVGKDADSIACILVTAGFSHMGLQAALTARESVPEPPIEIMDSRKALERLLEIMQERVDKGQRIHASIEQANVPEDAHWLEAQLSSLFDCAEIYINDFAPVAGVHCGPGVIGISFYNGTEEAHFYD